MAKRGRKPKVLLRPRLLVGQDSRTQWWDGGSFKKFAYIFCQKNYWKCQHWMELEDLQQEAFIWFVQCCKRYYWVHEPKHLMSLYKRFIWSRICEVVAMNRFEKENITRELHEVSSLIESIAGPGFEELEFFALLHDLPSELRSLLSCLVADSQQLFLEFKQCLPLRETNNERFCRLLGVDAKKFNLSWRLREWLRANCTIE